MGYLKNSFMAVVMFAGGLAATQKAQAQQTAPAKDSIEHVVQPPGLIKAGANTYNISEYSDQLKKLNNMTPKDAYEERVGGNVFLHVISRDTIGSTYAPGYVTNEDVFLVNQKNKTSDGVYVVGTRDFKARFFDVKMFDRTILSTETVPHETTPGAFSTFINTDKYQDPSTQGRPNDKLFNIMQLHAGLRADPVGQANFYNDDYSRMLNKPAPQHIVAPQAPGR